MAKDLSKVTCIADMRAIYRRRVPKVFVDYCDSGSWTENTYQQNENDFSHYCFRQKVLVDMNGRSLHSQMLGEAVTMPVAIAPTGLLGMQHADGEILAAQAAEAFGVPYIMSTVSICSVEDVAKATKRPFWFQLYMMKDRVFMQDLIARVKAAGCSTLVLTVDLQMIGQRHRDIKNGLGANRPNLINLLNMATKLPWCWRMLQTKRRSFGNIEGHVDNLAGMSSFGAWINQQFDPSLSWDDVAWIQQQWGGKLVIKGIMEVDDAQRAVMAGADALVVSNHGGRQLDGAPSTISVLPEIVDAVGEQIEIYLDSGIRTGQDILKSIALGAKGVLIGRAPIYGLGAYGKEGVTRVLEILHKEIDLSMAFCGKTQLMTVDSSILRKPTFI